jgi:hypothetical protein
VPPAQQQQKKKQKKNLPIEKINEITKKPNNEQDLESVVKCLQQRKDQDLVASLLVLPNI